MTHTKTRTVCHPWASTVPWECLIRDTGCISPDHAHSPMANDNCAHPDCTYTLIAGDECYAVIELPRLDGREQWVCWRHVQHENGDWYKGPVRGDVVDDPTGNPGNQ